MEAISLIYTEDKWKRLKILFSLNLLFVFTFFSCAGMPSMQKELSLAYYRLGESALSLANWKQSAEYFEKSIQLDPSLGKQSYNVALIFLKEKKFEEASLILDRLVKKNPDNVYIKKLLAFAYYQRGRWYLALDIYRDILLKLPQDPESLLNMGLILYGLKKYDQALKLLDSYTLYNQYTKNIFLLKYKIAKEKKEAEAQITYLTNVLEWEGNALLYAELIKLLKKHSLYKETLRIYDKWIDFTSFRSEKAFLYYQKGTIYLSYFLDLSSALTLFRKALNQGLLSINVDQKKTIWTYLNNSLLFQRDKVISLFEEVNLYQETWTEKDFVSSNVFLNQCPNNTLKKQESEWEGKLKDRNKVSSYAKIKENNILYFCIPKGDWKEEKKKEETLSQDKKEA